MFRLMRASLKSVPQRLRNHEKPERGFDFERLPYGNTPVKEIGYWKIHHGYDFGPEQLDYEDHSFGMLHQRPTHWRSFWVIFGASTSLCFWYYTWYEFPNFGIMFGQSYMDLKMNGIKYLNHDEKYHDWEGLLDQFNKILKAEEDGEGGEEETEEVAEEETGEAAEGDDLVEVKAKENESAEDSEAEEAE